MEKSLKKGESLFREGDSGTLWRLEQGVSGDFTAFAAVAEGYLQQQQRMHDMSKLRTGSVASRLKYLVQILAKSKDGKLKKLDRKDRPTLREMSQIMDITGETISWTADRSCNCWRLDGLDRWIQPRH